MLLTAKDTISLNRAVISSIAKDSIAEFAPDQLGVSVALIDPILDQIAQEEYSLPDDEMDEGGAFGGTDLVVTVVVPIIVGVVTEVLKEIAKSKLEEAKKSRSRKELETMIEIKLSDAHLTLQIPKGYRKNKRKLEELKKAIAKAILEYVRPE